MTADANLIQINIGPEYDDHLFESLKKILIIELEHFIGLSISGIPKLVSFISGQIKKMKL